MKIELADTHFKKMKGLMFRKNLNHALVFILRKKTIIGASIHSFFVFFPFDIIWLDNFKVVDFKENVKPFTLNVSPKKPSDCFIELPAGTIAKNKIKKGQKIKPKNGKLKL